MIRVKRNRRRMTDYAAAKYMIRFCDVEVDQQASKGLSLVEKAKSICKAKIKEHPKLSKVLAVLLQVDTFFHAVVGGGFIGVGIGTTAAKLAYKINKVRDSYAEEAPGLSLILFGIVQILVAIGKWKAASAIKNTLNEEGI